MLLRSLHFFVYCFIADVIYTYLHAIKHKNWWKSMFYIFNHIFLHIVLILSLTFFLLFSFILFKVFYVQFLISLMWFLLSPWLLKMVHSWQIFIALKYLTRDRQDNLVSPTWRMMKLHTDTLLLSGDSFIPVGMSAQTMKFYCVTNFN